MLLNYSFWLENIIFEVSLTLREIMLVFEKVFNS